MKTNLYWLKVGLLIGLGIILTNFLLPVGFIALVFLIPFFTVISILGFTARSLGSAVGYFKLRQGWLEREHRLVTRK